MLQRGRRSMAAVTGLPAVLGVRHVGLQRGRRSMAAVTVSKSLWVKTSDGASTGPPLDGGGDGS